MTTKTAPSGGMPRRPASRPAAIRYALGTLLSFGALNAFGGGYYGMSGAEGVPREWLRGSPFSDYTIPSLILFVVVGGSLLASAVAVFTRSRIAPASALAAGTIVLLWIAAQVGIMYVSWMQPVTALGGLAIVLLACKLPVAGDRKEGRTRRDGTRGHLSSEEQ